MLETKSIQTIYMANNAMGDSAQIDVWLGDTPATTDITSNSKCHGGNDAGVISCVGSGRYLSFELKDSASSLHFDEIYAWDEP